MLEHLIYLVISLEGLSSILFKDSSKAKEASEIMKLTSKDLYELGLIDKIIKELLNGAQEDVDLVANKIKAFILTRLS